MNILHIMPNIRYDILAHVSAIHVKSDAENYRSQDGRRSDQQRVSASGHFLLRVMPNRVQ